MNPDPGTADRHAPGGRFDLVVVGAGPAGAAAALRALCLRPEARVLLLDRATFPRDKTCGDGIGPESVRLLDELGVAGVLKGATPFDQLEIDGGAGSVVTGSVAEVGYVLPRVAFDHRLVTAAVDRGAELRQERVRRVEDLGDRVVINDRLQARVVVGADGANSVVRRHLAPGAQPDRHNAVAIRGYAHLPCSPPKLRFQLTWNPGPSYAWIFPGPDERANVGFGTFDGRRPLDRHELTAALSALDVGAHPEPASVRGHRLPLSTLRHVPARGRILLAGDAASLVNPLSGEGIATALLSGSLAGDCAVSSREPARAYQVALARLLRRHLRQVRLASRLYASPAVVHRALRTADRSPRVFEELARLSVGAGHLSAGTLVRMLALLPRATAEARSHADAARYLAARSRPPPNVR